LSTAERKLKQINGYMKKRCVFFIAGGLFCSTFNLFAQITSRATVTEKPAEVVLPFDSVTDMVTRENALRLKGQEIYLVPASKAYEEENNTKTTMYRNFYTSNSDNSIFVYKPVPYKLRNGDQSLASHYKALTGKYFKIVEVLDQTDEKIYSRYSNDGKTGVFLKLEGKEDHETVYYHFFSQNWTITGPKHEGFIFTGIYEKAKQKYLNKRFMTYSDDGYKTKELNTGQDITYANLQWTCTEVTLVDRPNVQFQVIALVFKDTASREIAVFLNEEFSGSSLVISKFKSEDERLAEIKAANEKEKRNVEAYKLRRTEMIKKYGVKFGPLIADREVAIGMNKKMCVDAWGEPDHINVTSTNTTGRHEQWVYNLRSYIYFDNNVLTAIQSTHY
jgi:hypothetical protein